MIVDFVAPKKVYQIPRSPVSERTQAGGYTISVPLALAKTATGGMATWFSGHPYPRKTFVYAGINEPNNNVKRVTLSLFLPFASLRNGIKAFLNSYLFNYNRLVDSLYNDADQIPYLHYQYYSEFGKALWDFIYLFLKKIGIKNDIAYRTGLQLATIIEYDDAYKVRLQDILNECDKDALLRTPHKEILRLLEIYKGREPAFLEGDLRTAGVRMVGMAKMLSYLLYVPWIRNAFKFALENVNFEWFKCDDWDYYWALNRGDYNTFGRSLEDRKEESIQMMIDFMKKMNPGKEVRRIPGENGEVKLETYEVEALNA